MEYPCDNMSRKEVMEHWNITDNSSLCVSNLDGTSLSRQIGFLTFCFLENLILLIAAILDKERLTRQSCVYICVVSTIAMNLALSTLPAFLSVKHFLYPKYSLSSPGKITGVKVCYTIALIIFY